MLTYSLYCFSFTLSLSYIHLSYSILYCIYHYADGAVGLLKESGIQDLPLKYLVVGEGQTNRGVGKAYLLKTPTRPLPMTETT